MIKVCRVSDEYLTFTGYYELMLFHWPASTGGLLTRALLRDTYVSVISVSAKVLIFCMKATNVSVNVVLLQCHVYIS